MGLPVAVSFLIFVAIGASIDAQADDCPSCLGGKSPSAVKRNFSRDQHILHFDLSCRINCQSGLARDIQVKSDFHQFPNVGGNPYPHNFFSIELYVANQNKCSELARTSCEKMGGIKSARAIRVASGNWTWDYVANPFKCTANRAQPSPFDTEKFTIRADDVPEASRVTNDPNHRYMKNAPKLGRTLVPVCGPAPAKVPRTPDQVDVGVCAGCYDESVGDAVMTPANFGSIRCDLDKLEDSFGAELENSPQKTLNKQDEARRFCLDRIAHEVKSFAPLNPGCPGYSFDTDVCDAFEARVVKSSEATNRASEGANSKVHEKIKNQ